MRLYLPGHQIATTPLVLVNSGSTIMVTLQSHVRVLKSASAGKHQVSCYAKLSQVPKSWVDFGCSLDSRWTKVGQSPLSVQPPKRECPKLWQITATELAKLF